MIPDAVTKEAVEAAFAEIRTEGVPARREATKYLVLHEGMGFPPKYVISVAYRLTTGEKLSSSAFSGGKEANSFLQRLGFPVVRTNPVESPPAETESKGHRETRAAGTRSRETDPGSPHTGENCRACKNTIADLLDRLYGGVVEEQSTGLGTRPKALELTDHEEALQRIWNLLVEQRGKADFVRSPTLQPFDFYIPSEQLAIEFDESQHFTEARLLSLEAYPEEMELGFDREAWMDLCPSVIG